MPIAVSSLLDTPINGHSPKNCTNTKLLTKTAPTKSSAISPSMSSPCGGLKTTQNRNSRQYIRCLAGSICGLRRRFCWPRPSLPPRRRRPAGGAAQMGRVHVRPAAHGGPSSRESTAEKSLISRPSLAGRASDTLPAHETN